MTEVRLQTMLGEFLSAIVSAPFLLFMVEGEWWLYALWTPR